jgi:glycosyltransferase involved in cell wall biosynthesis
MLTKLLTDWFSSLDKDSQLSIDKFTFEDPSSLTKLPCPSIYQDPSKFISIVIPAYNEQDRLPATLEETLSYLQRRRDRQGPYFTYEVIVVDDGSRDGTASLVFNAIRKHGMDAVRLLKLPGNRGKGYAVKSGALCSRGAKILTMDADGATRVSEVERLEAMLGSIAVPEGSSSSSSSSSSNGGGGNNITGMSTPTQQQKSITGGSSTPSSLSPSPYSWSTRRKPPSSSREGERERGTPLLALSPSPLSITTKSNNSNSNNLGFVLGSRAHMQEMASAKRSPLRNFLMHGFHFLVMMVVGNEIRDTQCGFKLYTRAAAARVFTNQRLQRWCFDVEHVLLAQKLKVPMAEVGVTWTEIPGSKIRPSSVVHMALELVLLKMGYGLGMWSVVGPYSENSRGVGGGCLK